MLGFPAIALPAGFDDRGLPVALQIVGRARTDLRLLALGQTVQDRSHWHARIPDAVADAVTDLTKL
jgi:aspartyl-tRNA(Asn)/glutamyl-tRNA(Gln) amidotransferase subunit A